MNKLAVVTGGTKGIGKAILCRFAEHGFDIVTCSRHQGQLEVLKEEVEKEYKHTTVFVTKADLSSKDEIQHFCDYVLSFQNPIEVLVNNAGFFLPGQIHTEPEGQLEKLISGNLYSAYYTIRGLVTEMKKHRRGHIFNICSVASFMAYPNGGSYAISKFAMLGMSRSLREELKSEGIRVTAVMPGATLTDSWSGVDLPSSRFMPPEDVAEMVLASYKLSSRSVVEDIIIRPQEGDI